MAKLLYDGKEYPLESERAVIGRHRTCAIQVRDDAASRQHCQVFWGEGHWWVKDLESANGTVLNGRPLEGKAWLRGGDRIGIGACEIVFQGKEGESARLPSAAASRPATPDAPDYAALVGETLAGKVRVETLIGKGTLGAVYKGTQLNLQRAVAVKTFNPALASDAGTGLRERFVGECGRVGSLTHPSLIQLHECGEHKGVLWCSMEWVEGDPLAKVLARDGRLQPAMALLICEKVAEAVGYAHGKGVVHGDLRPNTVLLTADGGIKVTDIGMAQIFEAGRFDGHAPASLAWYMSPEQAVEGVSDPRSDIYALGCVLFHLLTGKPPFDGTDAKAVVRAHREAEIPSVTAHQLPARLDGLLHGMLTKNLAWRFASMSEVAAEMRATAVGLGEKPVRPARLQQIKEQVAARQQAQEARKQEGRLRNLIFLVLIMIGLGIVAVVALPLVRKPISSEPLFDFSRPPVPPLPDKPDLRRPPARDPVLAQGPVAPATSGSPAVRPPPEPVSRLPAAPVSLAAVETLVQQERWEEARKALQALSGAGGDQGRAAKVRLERLELECDAWYRRQVAALPAADGGSGLAARLTALASLRDRVPAALVSDAESRYQEAITRINQRLLAARRSLRQAVEAGRLAELPGIAERERAAFLGTPVEGLHRQLVRVSAEAAQASSLWAGSWELTRRRLPHAKGEAALSAAALLLLAGEPAQARSLLADPGLAQGELLRRRESLLGREAAVLAFDDPADLLALDVLRGEPQIANGSLSGRAAEPVSVACSVPVAGNTWEVAASLILRGGRGESEALFSLVEAGSTGAMLRLNMVGIEVRLRGPNGWVEVRPARSAGEQLRLRFACRGGNLRLLLDDQVVAECPQAQIAPGSRLRFECVGYDWQILDLQVLNGGE